MIKNKNKNKKKLKNSSTGRDSRSSKAEIGEM